MQYVTLFKLQFIGTFALDFVFDGDAVGLFYVLACTTFCFVAFCDLAWSVGDHLSFELNLALVIFLFISQCLSSCSGLAS